MKVRVRFAPSPTGGLHLGGVRTVLYNYLFAKKHGGTFILRIEDTDRNRFVEGAEEYIYSCLEWCGLMPDESTIAGGNYGPYRQSERKPLYFEYAQKLLNSGHAYYAFDTPEELEAMREHYKANGFPNPQYDHNTRLKMRNSLTLTKPEVQKLLDDQTPYVVRIKVDPNVLLTITDMIRGEVTFDCALVDDKVLLKADGMPTYHLAVVVDDYLMKITHAFRGEEWLPSAPVHILLWEYLGWKDQMPQWAHLPLILKPDGNGKLSKRDGERLGFPVFAMNWTDPRTGESARGFRELGFIPAAFTNMLAMLGWNDGTGKEIFTTEELCERFSIERVHKGGAKFDYEKAKWFNNQYIQQMDADKLFELVKPFVVAKFPNADDLLLRKVIALVKDRCTLLTDFWEQGHFFFTTPEVTELQAIREKWSPAKAAFFAAWATACHDNDHPDCHQMEADFAALAATHQLKKGELMLPLRIMLVGAKFGPGVFHISELIGGYETAVRIRAVLELLS